MLYNVFSNAGNWESDMLGLVQTIETFPDNIHTALGIVAEQQWKEWFDGVCPLYSAHSVHGDCMDLYAKYELSAFFDGEAVAGIVVSDDCDVTMILVLVPAKLTVI